MGLKKERYLQIAFLPVNDWMVATLFEVGNRENNKFDLELSVAGSGGCHWKRIDRHRKNDGAATKGDSKMFLSKVGTG
jgi:hypothetical protein